MTSALVRYARSFTGFGRNARLFLITTIVYGSALGLYWADFNLYLERIGVDRGTIGVLMAVSQLAAVLIAFPCGALSNRLGRRAVMAGGIGLVVLALLAVLPGNLALLFVGVAAFGAGSQAVSVVQIPYIAEQTRPEERNEYFAVWAAIQNFTYMVALLAGGFLADLLTSGSHLTNDPAPYRVLLVGTVVLGGLALASTALLSGDRPVRDEAAVSGAGRFGIVIKNRRIFVRLLLPIGITALGAGQLIPFLNLFVENKFHLDLPAVNSILAVTSLGTVVAIMVQPALAKRFGRIGSVVLVQGASIPFLAVLGFSPMLWSVVIAMAVRNSLMNAGSPILDAFAMDNVSVEERATLSAAWTLVWAAGWTVGPLYYGALQSMLGFDLGYAVDFVTIIVLYSTATALLWTWFRRADFEPAVEPATDLATAEAQVVEAAVALERA